MGQVKDIAQYKTRNNIYLKHNYKLGPEEEKKLCLAHLMHHPVDDLLKEYNITERTYYNIVSKHKKNNYQILDEDIKELRQNFSKKTSILIDKLLYRIEQELDSGKDVNISQLTTSLGILKDKQSIDLGQATSNSAISINIKVDN